VTSPIASSNIAIEKRKAISIQQKSEIRDVTDAIKGGTVDEADIDRSSDIAIQFINDEALNESENRAALEDADRGKPC
jgi:hypothetical protein